MVGIVAGFGAVAFRDLIGLVHNLLFLGQFAIRYDANIFTPASPWGPFVILVPVVGAIGVTFLVTKFAPEARGHGVPEVMDAIYYNGGVIRPIVAVVKSLASAIAIGSGAAVGREGPIIQIGSAFGSTLGQIIRMPQGQRITLVAAGAGAGIAATFNTPIGGVLFAIELMMPEVSVRTFLPVAIATGTATFIGRVFFGDQPAFVVPLPPLQHPDVGAALLLFLYAILGVITGLAATGFVRGLHFLEDQFDRIKGPYVRHVLGMLLVGLLIYALHANFGHYYVEGVGYATIQAIVFGQLNARLALGAAVRLQAVCHDDEPGVGIVGRDFLALPLYGRDARRRLRFGAHRRSRAAPDRCAGLRDGRHGGDGRRRHRRGNDRRHDDLRDDARLQHRPADDSRRGVQSRRAPRAVAGKHLHDEAEPPRPHGAQRPCTPTCFSCAAPRM